MRRTGDEYFDSKEFSQLIDSYEQAVNTGQPVLMDSDELAEIADYYQMTNHMEEAEQAIDLALQLSPGAISPLVYKIHEALFNNDPDEAERLLDQIIDRSDPDYVYTKGEIMIARNEVEQATEYFTEETGNVPEEEFNDYIIDVANIYQNYDLPQEALAWLDKATDQQSQNFRELRGRALHALGHFKEAEAIFTQLVDEDPYSKFFWTSLSSAQLMLGNTGDAMTSCEFAIAIDPCFPDAIVIKANIYFRNEKYEEALDYYRRYSDVRPKDELVLLQQSYCLINLGHNDEALQVLCQAERVAPPQSPYMADILMEKVFIYGEQHDTENAIRNIEKAAKYNVDPSQANLVKGHVLLAAGMIDKAEEAFRQAVLDSTDPYHTMLSVIVSTIENDYYKVAYMLLKQFFDAVPEDFNEGNAYMALCCYHLHYDDEFLDYLEKACQTTPEECKAALSDLFPANVEPADYYNYVKENMNL